MSGSANCWIWSLYGRRWQSCDWLHTATKASLSSPWESAQTFSSIKAEIRTEARSSRKVVVICRCMRASRWLTLSWYCFWIRSKCFSICGNQCSTVSIVPDNTIIPHHSILWEPMQYCQYCPWQHNHTTSFYSVGTNAALSVLSLTTQSYHIILFCGNQCSTVSIGTDNTIIPHHSILWEPMQHCQYRHWQHNHTTSFYSVGTNAALSVLSLTTQSYHIILFCGNQCSTVSIVPDNTIIPHHSILWEPMQHCQYRHWQHNHTTSFYSVGTNAALSVLSLTTQSYHIILFCGNQCSTVSIVPDNTIIPHHSILWEPMQHCQYRHWEHNHTTSFYFVKYFLAQLGLFSHASPSPKKNTPK